MEELKPQLGGDAKWVVMAHRSSASRIGAASAPCRDGDRIMLFDSEEAARKVAVEYNAATLSPNVHYTVERWA